MIELELVHTPEVYVMSIFLPPKMAGYRWGVLMLIIITGIVAFPILLTLRLGIQGPAATLRVFHLSMTAVVLLVSGMFVYLLYALKTMQYEITPDDLIIRWGAARVRVPLGRIKGVEKVPGTMTGIRTFGVSWPGYYVGVFRMRGLGKVDMFATRLKGEVVLVHTAERSFVLTPEDMDPFVQQLEQQVAAAAPEFEEALQPVASFWADPLAVLLVAGNVLVFLGEMYYLTRLIPTLPSRIPAHWDLTGRITRYASTGELYMLPAIGGAAAALPVIMGVLQQRHTRKTLYFMAAIGLFLQVFFFVLTLGWIGSIRG